MINKTTALALDNSWIFHLLFFHDSLFQKVVFIWDGWKGKIIDFFNANENWIVHEVVVSQKLWIPLNDINQSLLLFPSNIKLKLLLFLKKKIVLVLQSFSVCFQKFLECWNHSAIKCEVRKMHRFCLGWLTRESFVD